MIIIYFLVVAGRSSKYSRSPTGLRIENVSRSDRGVYICRARLANTGQMEERKIEVEVSGGDCGDWWGLILSLRSNYISRSENLRTG